LPDRPVGIAFAGDTGKIYWTLEGGELQRANLDGTNPETVLSGLESPWDVVLVASIPTVNHIPAASTWGLVALALAVLTAGTLVAFRRTTALAQSVG
jgi:hypothetical protein